MKTIMDAVNDLKGDLDSCEYTAKHWQDLGFKYLCESDSYTKGKFVFALTKNHGENTICSIYAFNELVTELSNWQPTLPKVEMVETVEVDGLIYEIGTLYGISDKGRDQQARWHGMLERCEHTESGYCPCFSMCSLYEVINPGTITPAPTKLIDNNIYTFELNCDLWSGFYRESRGSFFT